jgi:hypothetical protein
MKQRKPLLRKKPMPRGKPLQPRRRTEGPTAEREPKPMTQGEYDAAMDLAEIRLGIAFPFDPGYRPRGTYAGGTSGVAIQKEDASQSGPYMAAAKALGYCMRCDRKVAPHTGGLDFCHADAGKGMGLKTDVRRGWPGCRACHEIVGRKLPRAVRRAVEYLLGVMTRAAIIATGTWPARLPLWEQEQQ